MTGIANFAQKLQWKFCELFKGAMQGTKEIKAKDTKRNKPNEIN